VPGSLKLQCTNSQQIVGCCFQLSHAEKTRVCILTGQGFIPENPEASDKNFKTLSNKSFSS
jgi:hypothetical protein